MTKIAVVIPYFNYPEKLIASIRSIDETGGHAIDIVVVDDGSTDKLDLKTIEDYRYGKIHLITFKENQGVNFARNAALEWIVEQGEYSLIGFLDAGDFCLPNRFKIQIEYLKNNPEVKLIGSQVNFVNMNREFLYTTKLPSKYAELKKMFYLNSQVFQPAAMMKTEIISKIGYYPKTYKIATDYGYFFKILERFRVENIDIPLIDYVVDDTSISSTKRKEQVRTRIRVILEHFYFGYYPIYGLLRNIALLFVSRDFSDRIKRLIYR